MSYVAVHAAGLRACVESRERLTLLWLTEQADNLRWREVPIAMPASRLEQVTGDRSRRWVKPWVLRMEQVGVLRVVSHGDRNNPRQIVMLPPFFSADRTPVHAAEHAAEHANGHTTPDMAESGTRSGTRTRQIGVPTQLNTNTTPPNPPGGGADWDEGQVAFITELLNAYDGEPHQDPITQTWTTYQPWEKARQGDRPLANALAENVAKAKNLAGSKRSRHVYASMIEAARRHFEVQPSDSQSQPTGEVA